MPKLINPANGQRCEFVRAERGYTEKDIERFWSHVAITANPDKCWEWQASLRGDYGRIKINKVSLSAHRVSYEISKGEIPDGMCVCHHCDNKLCVNPKHLFLGTSLDNVQDKMTKGRYKPVRGDSHGSRKLNSQEVIRIRHLYANDGISQAELSRQFGVCRPTIHKIIIREIWRHI